MRTYLALAERARQLRRAAGGRGGARGRLGTPELARALDGSAREEADALKAEADGLDELALRGYANEALDQLLVEVLLGVR